MNRRNFFKIAALSISALVVPSIACAMVTEPKNSPTTNENNSQRLSYRIRTALFDAFDSFMNSRMFYTNDEIIRADLVDHMSHIMHHFQDHGLVVKFEVISDESNNTEDVIKADDLVFHVLYVDKFQPSVKKLVYNVKPKIITITKDINNEAISGSSTKHSR